MEKINIKDFAVLKTLKNQIDRKYNGNEIEKIFKNYIQQTKTNAIYHTTAEAWNGIKFIEKAKVVKFNKEYFLFNYENNIFPFLEKEKYSLNNLNKFLQVFSEDEYINLGEYSLLNQTQLRKLLKLKSTDNAEVIVSHLPKELQDFIDIEVKHIFSLKKNKINDNDILITLKKIDLYNEFMTYLKHPDYLLKKDLEGKILLYINMYEDIFLDKNKQEVFNFFNYTSNYYIKLKNNFSFSKELNEFFVFKVSNKKLNDFIKKNNIKKVEDIGVERKKTIYLSDTINSLESLKEWERNNLKAFYKKSSNNLNDYLEKIKKEYEPNAFINIKKNINKKKLK